MIYKREAIRALRHLPRMVLPPGEHNGDSVYALSRNNKESSKDDTLYTEESKLRPKSKVISFLGDAHCPTTPLKLSQKSVHNFLSHFAQKQTNPKT